MTRRRNIAAHILVGLALTAGVAWLTHALRARTERFFAGALRSAHAAEDVSRNGVLFHVEDGEVFRSGAPVTGLDELPALELAYAKTLARTAPLLAFPGVDPQTLLSAVQDLRATQAQLAQTQANARDAALVRDDLYPIGFLERAAALEAARQKFLATGSDADARAYARASAAALAAYDTDLTHFRAGFVRAVPSNARAYSAGGLLITRQDTLAALDALERASSQVGAELALRVRCLAGDTDACRPQELKPPVLPPLSGPAIVPQEITRAEDVRTTLETAEGAGTLPTAPLMGLSSLTCLAGTNLPPLITAHAATATPALSDLEYVGDIRLTKSTDHPEVAFDSFFAARGVTYLPSNPLRYYECPYTGADFGRAYAVRAVSEAAALQPLSALASGALAQTLRAFERKLSPGNPVITEADAQDYVRAAQAGSDPALANAAAALALLLADHAAGTVALVRQISEVERQNVFARVHNGVPTDVSAAALFYYRSAFLFFFLGDNPSFVQAPDAYFAPLASATSTDPFLFFSKLPQQAQAQAASDLHTFMTYHLPGAP